MKVVLLERIGSLGTIGDVVNVKPGFARNFLLPKDKALRATAANLAKFEAQREVLEARNAEQAASAIESGKDLDGKTFIMIRKAGETGMLYGSVSARDVAEQIAGPVTRSMVVLEQPIKELGLHPVKVQLHAEVEITVEINVARSEDEAVRQAEGEDVIQMQADEDRAQAEEANAERSEIAREMFEDGGGLGDE